MFQLGRTDTIRSCSPESLEFTKAMLDTNTPVSKKAELLRRAVGAHKQYTNDVSVGKQHLCFHFRAAYLLPCHIHILYACES